MKDWYELSKSEQKNLKRQFKKRKKIIDFRIILYLLSFAAFFMTFSLIIFNMNGECYGNACNNNSIIFGSLFIITFLLAVINSIAISNWNKQFEKWLVKKDIEK